MCLGVFSICVEDHYANFELLENVEKSSYVLDSRL